MIQEHRYSLTRVCLRRGELTLSRSLTGLFDSDGPVTVSDSLTGTELQLDLQGQRVLSGLGAFFEEHELDVNRTMQLIREITLETGRPVDLIDLRVAGPRIGQQVIRNGSELFVRSRTELAEFITRTIIDAADFLPIVDSAVKENLDTWTRE